MKDIKLRLLSAACGSCNCLTKTPETQFHDENCDYRIIIDAADEIDRLRNELAKPDSKPIGYAKIEELDRLKSPAISGRPVFVSKEPGKGRMAIYSEQKREDQNRLIEIARESKPFITLESGNGQGTINMKFETLERSHNFLEALIELIKDKD